MAEVAQLADYREETYINLSVETDGEMLIVCTPASVYEDIISGKLDIEDVDEWKPLMRRITEEWLHRTLGLGLSDNSGWECNCGCQLFTILTTGFCCSECGTTQSFDDLP